MNAGFVVAVAIALAGVGSGCVSTQACGLVGCLDALDVTVTGFESKFGAALPVTAKVCVAGTCTSYRVDKTGAAPTCTPLTAGLAGCALDGQGTLVLSAVPLPTGASGAVTVELGVSGKTSALYDATQMVSITTSEPNGPGCGTCISAATAFAP